MIGVVILWGVKCLAIALFHAPETKKKIKLKKWCLEMPSLKSIIFTHYSFENQNARSKSNLRIDLQPRVLNVELIPLESSWKALGDL